MLKNRNILCVANPTWEGDYAKTIVELMTVATKNNHVLYTDYPFTFKDLIMSLMGKSKAPWQRMLGLERRVRKITLPNKSYIYVFTPPTILTINFLPEGILYRKLLKFNSHRVTQSIKKALKELRMEENILVFNAFNPGMSLYELHQFQEKLHIYHCYDQIAASQWVGNHGASLEAEYIPKVDAVICTSKNLYLEKNKLNKHTYFVPNGVNFELFHQGFTNNIAQKKKVIGYIGTIDNRLDYGLLELLFTEFLNWEFHFVGRCNYPQGLALLRKHPNVKVSDPKPVHELPDVLSTFHAGLIPFVENEFTKSIYPLKINEYLATGIPVILTNFSDLNEFVEIASICNNAQEFIHTLKEEVFNDTIEKREERMEVGRKNSWLGRWGEIERIIEELESTSSLSQ